MTILNDKIDENVLLEFRSRLRKNIENEPTDPENVLNWLENLRQKKLFESHLIKLSAVEDWSVHLDTGNIEHSTGQFFSVEGVRTKAHGLREVNEWDQPIFNQIEGGILAIISGEIEGSIKFLLHAKAEPGNIDGLQIAPTLQCTQSNLKKAHLGGSPPLSNVLSQNAPSRLIYCAKHNEEGGRFWQKSNINCIIHIDDIEWIENQLNEYFMWVSLSQIKKLCLIDNIISPFVKTIIAPI
ncbi:MAG: NDP-hexose 2,3-dehydratase family protein [Pseudomonadota bacterium]|nr:NDP-hexose 2,3-dehydratase family protein [Pseudomonadota bacterium]